MSLALHAFGEDEAPARRLAEAMALPLNLVQTHRFPDGEIVPRTLPPGRTTLVYRSLADPNEKLIELLLAADAWRRNGADRLILIAPYLCYMRQDAEFSRGEPVSQRVIAGLLDRTFDRILTVDPHLHRTSQLADLFAHAQSTHLHGADALISSIEPVLQRPDLVVVGPDVESAPWTARIAARLKASSVTLVKRRRGDNNVDLAAPDAFPVAGRPVLIVDDICSTGGTLIAATRLAREAGASSVVIFVTHALFKPALLHELRIAGADRVLSTDSCTHPTNAVALAPILAEALQSER